MKMLKELEGASPVAKQPPTREGSLPSLHGNRPSAIRADENEARIADEPRSQPSGEGPPNDTEGGQPSDPWQTPVPLIVSRPMIRWVMADADKTNTRVVVVIMMMVIDCVPE